MNCLKKFYNQQHQLQGSLINGKNVSKINPLIVLVQDSDTGRADDALHLSTITNHSSVHYTILRQDTSYASAGMYSVIYCFI
jgi:hypothetical protein